MHRAVASHTDKNVGGVEPKPATHHEPGTVVYSAQAGQCREMAADPATVLDLLVSKAKPVSRSRDTRARGLDSGLARAGIVAGTAPRRRAGIGRVPLRNIRLQACPDPQRDHKQDGHHPQTTSDSLPQWDTVPTAYKLNNS